MSDADEYGGLTAAVIDAIEKKRREEELKEEARKELPHPLDSLERMWPDDPLVREIRRGFA